VPITSRPTASQTIGLLPGQKKEAFASCGFLRKERLEVVQGHELVVIDQEHFLRVDDFAEVFEALALEDDEVDFG